MKAVLEKLRQMADPSASFVALPFDLWSELIAVVDAADALVKTIDWYEREEAPVSGYIRADNNAARTALALLREQVIK